MLRATWLGSPAHWDCGGEEVTRDPGRRTCAAPPKGRQRTGGHRTAAEEAFSLHGFPEWRHSEASQLYSGSTRVIKDRVNPEGHTRAFCSYTTRTQWHLSCHETHTGSMLFPVKRNKRMRATWPPGSLSTDRLPQSQNRV